MKIVDSILGLYRKLSRALPEEFQRQHGPDMVRTTEDLVHHTVRRPAGLIAVVVRVFADLFWRIPVEHAANIRQDALYSLRMLAKSKGFTIASVISLGIGIGLTVSIFSQVESITLADVPQVANPAELVVPNKLISFPDYEHFRDQSGLFSSVAAYIAPVPFLIGSDANTYRVWGHIVSTNYFDVLGTRIASGRAFDSNEQASMNSATAVISNRFWKTRLGGDPAIIGRTLRVNGNSVTIIGVGPEDFLGASPLMAAADLWLPVTADSRLAPELSFDTLRNRRAAEFKIIGRLRAGLAIPEAQSAFDTILRQLEGVPAAQEQRGRKVSLLTGGRLVPIREQDTWIMVGLPFLIVGLTLWIACSNVGTLLLARGGLRQKEIAIRVAMGASRTRVVRQLITESVVLAILGGVVGWLFAVWSNSTMDWFTVMLPEFINVQLSLDWTAFFFASGLTLVSGILFGLAPALQASRSEVVYGLKGGNLAGGRKYRWFSSRNMLVLQQVAGSLMLLLITGFVVLGFNRSASPDLGFNPNNIYMMSIDPVRDGYTPERANELLSSLPERVKRVPGIEEATITYKIPLGMFSDDSALQAKTTNDFANLKALRVERVSVGFFETVGVPMVRGRSFKTEDGSGNSLVAIVNETMANETWPGQDPVGNSIEIEAKRYEVVGVTKNFRSGALLEPSRQGAFLPIASREIARPSAMGVTLMVRTQPGFDPMAAMRQEMNTIDTDLTILSTSRLTDEVDNLMSIVHITTLTYGGIGVFGLILACVGLGGVTAYTVSQRTKEIGIRMALGARRLDVLRLVLKEGLILVVVGTFAGQALAWAAVRAMGAFFESLATITQTSTSDPLLVVGAPVLLGALTMLACLMPARRATRIDPLESLRQE